MTFRRIFGLDFRLVPRKSAQPVHGNRNDTLQRCHMSSCPSDHRHRVPIAQSSHWDVYITQAFPDTCSDDSPRCTRRSSWTLCQRLFPTARILPSPCKPRSFVRALSPRSCSSTPGQIQMAPPSALAETPRTEKFRSRRRASRYQGAKTTVKTNDFGGIVM